MSVKDTYKTFSSRSEGLIKEKGSKFIAHGFPVYNEKDIKEALDKTKKEFYDARHHCYAWRLGANGEPFRANDDGEPSYSAGKPILSQLLKFELSNALIIVVRYFGGVKLGVGGLISAYRSASEDCINNAMIIEKEITNDIAIQFNYSNMNDAMMLVKKLDLNVVDRNFQVLCEMTIRAKLNDTEQIKKEIDGVFGLEWKIKD